MFVQLLDQVSPAVSAVVDALGLGGAVVDVAYTGLNSTISVLDEIKTRLVAAREPGVDKGKVQKEIEQLKTQAAAIAQSSNFNGVNWLKTGLSQDLADISSFGTEVVAAFSRSSQNQVSVKTIDIDRSGAQGLICNDNIRADIKVKFFVRVNNVADDVLKVAQSIGCARASNPETLEELFSAKFSEALKSVAAFRLALPRTMLRFAGGREITLGDLGAKQGILGGINAVIVGNYLTTLGRPAESDLELLEDLQMPIKALNASL